jgi:PIN domain nuclease of toxin-antitoxin system
MPVSPGPSPTSPRNAPSGSRWTAAWCETAVVALVAARSLVPTEGASEGGTLWIALAALVAWLIGLLLRQVEGHPPHRFGLLDLGVALLVGGHLLGGGVVWFAGGDRRAALNLQSEWLAVAAFWWLLREAVRSPRGRATLVVSTTCLGFAIASLGLQQHWIEFPAMAADYAATKAREQTTRASPVELSRIEAELARSGVPTDPAARMLWEQRVLHSREPLGFFALANSLAGLLLVVLLLTSGWLLGEWFARKGSSSNWIVPAALLTVVLVCLVLTKSRTAYVGLLVGVTAAAIGLRFRSQQEGLSLAWKRLVAVSLGLLFLVVLGAGLTGGLDRLVLSEAEKSIRYRAEYWWATTAMLAQSPERMLLGVGLGNFRQQYLPHKLPSSSEEIADPHNLLLDAWSNGGLAAVAGLVILFAAWWSSLRRRPIGLDAATRLPRLATMGLAGLVMGGLIAFALSDWSDDRILAVTILALVVTGLVGLVPFGDAGQITAAAAGLALATHLLGAGGIGMPAIVQVWLIALALGCGRNSDDESTSASSLRWRWLPDLLSLRNQLAPVMVLVLATFVVWGALWPVTQATQLSDAADTAIYVDRDDVQALALLDAAATADRYAAAPHIKQGQLHLARSSRRTLSQAERDQEFSTAIAALESAVARDPDSAATLQLVGQAWRTRWLETASEAAAHEAATWLRRALARYPNDAALAVDLAEVAPPAEARAVARRAIELDRLAEQYGHTDKRLPPPRKALAERLAPGDLVPPSR